MTVLKKYRHGLYLGLGVWIFVVGISIGFLIPGQSPLESEARQIRLGQSGFTNPLLDCDVGGNSIATRKEDFIPELQTVVNALIAKQEITDVAVYYRDLNNGPVDAVNASETFLPASLLKVPIMMTLLHESESNPAILNEKITYNPGTSTPQLSTMQTIVPQESIKAGQTYTISQLIVYMIEYSDNNAMNLLFNRVPIADQIDLYNQLGVDSSVLTNATGGLTVKQYSVFFRILYNSSYLSRTDSEFALSLLSKTDFDNGLRAGVPSNIVISHKFGERQLNGGLQQLHDCGIVYYPNHPYLLCVMSRGTDMSSLSSALSDISLFVYNKIHTEFGDR